MWLQRYGAVVVVTIGWLLVSGCQSYTPRPLDLAGHQSAWRDRSPAGERVATFARRLEAHGSLPGVFDPADGITLAEAEVIALVFNADLRLARARADIAAATAAHAGLWEDPVFQIDLLRITQSVSNPWFVAPRLGLTIPLSGRLGVEKDRANAAMIEEHHAIAEAEWDVRTRVRRAWVDWSAARLRLDETDALVKQLEAMVQSTDLLAQAGEMPRTQATLFSIELAQRRSERIQFQREVRTARLRIHGLLGLSPGAPMELVASMSVGSIGSNGSMSIGPTVSAEMFDAMTGGNLTLRRLAAAYDVAEQTLRREIRKQYPDLSIGPSMESDRGQSRIGLFGAIPIPILNANKRGIAEARAARELARAAYEIEIERVGERYVDAQERAASIGLQRAELERVVVPLVDRQLDDAAHLLQIGEVGGLVLLESLVRAQETKMRLIALRREESHTQAETLQLFGPPPPETKPDQQSEDPTP